MVCFIKKKTVIHIDIYSALGAKQNDTETGSDSTEASIQVNSNQIQDNERQIDQSSTTTTTEKLNFDSEFKECIESFEVFDKNKTKLRYVRCKVCVALPNIVRMNSDNKKPAPITTIEGARYRQSYVVSHFESKCHKSCKMVINLPNESKSGIDIHFSNANKKLASHVSKLLFDIYVDAKKMTNSAYSWPSRFVAAEAGRIFNYDDNHAQTIPHLNLQYVNPNMHLELLHTIVRSDKESLKNKLKKAIACSLRIDGSIDRTQVDKIYTMLKIIRADGKMELIFLGVGKQISRGATGLFDAVKSGIIENIGEDLYKTVMSRISSVCTDGTNVNTGEKGGLWKLIEDEIRRIGSIIPFTKIWCSAHRMELVWGDVCNIHSIINNTLNEISSISSYFHQSGLRTNELRLIAAEKKINLTMIPKLFTIRWTEFSATIMNNILQSWSAVMSYFDANKDNDSKANGYFLFLSKIENLRNIAFLADLLHIFSRYQKRTQNNNLTIVSLVQGIHSLRSTLVTFKEGVLLGGWEEALNTDVEKKNGKLILKGFELQKPEDGRTRPKNVAIDFNNIRNSIIDSIINRISDRFESDESLMEIIEPFLTIDKSADLRKIHERFGSDLDLSSTYLQYNEMVDQKIAQKLDGKVDEIITALASNTSNSKTYKEVLTILARIQVCTPHSSDVERCISANNLLKTPLRNSVSLETEVKYLYVHFNMPALENWDPRLAIKLWMEEKQRKDFSSVMERKATYAPYFKGIFKNAQEEKEICDDDEIKKMKKF